MLSLNHLSYTIKDPLITMSFYTASRLALASYHLLFSLVLSSIIGAVISLVWYPPPLLQASGVLPIMAMMIGITLIVPPLLTFLVYKANKKELMRDIAIIGALQVLALLYGLFVIEDGRPAYLVFAVDDFETVTSTQVSWAQQNTKIKTTANPNLGVFEHPKYVYSPFSADERIRAVQQTEELTNGISITYRVDNYQPIATAGLAIKTKAQPLTQLNNYNDSQRVNNILHHYPTATGWLPLKASVLDMVVLTDTNGAVIDLVNLRPWSE